MKILTNSIVASALLVLSTTVSFAQGSCEDDPRMARISDFVTAKMEGDVEPMQLTSETFFNLTPVVRDALGEDILLLDDDCETHQVLNGVPATRLEVPFAEFYNGFYDAVARNDSKSTEIILTSFRPAPLDLMALMPLFTSISAPSKIEEKMMKILSVTGLSTNDIPASNCKVEEEQHYLTLAEIFVASGGRVVNGNDPAVIAVPGLSSKQFYIFPGAVPVSAPNSGVVDKTSCQAGSADVARLLTEAGAMVYNSKSNYVDDYEIEAIEEWVKNQKSGDSSPLDSSIFD
jgi:hypothetical protein